MNQSAKSVVSPSTLEVVALGGLGEFGMNMMALSWEDTTILVDAGVMFPEPDQLGVDLIIPDMSFVESRRDNVKALVLTHGHEDHIGAVPHVLELFSRDHRDRCGGRRERRAFASGRHHQRIEGDDGVRLLRVQLTERREQQRGANDGDSHVGSRIALKRRV